MVLGKKTQQKAVKKYCFVYIAHVKFQNTALIATEIYDKLLILMAETVMPAIPIPPMASHFENMQEEINLFIHVVSISLRVKWATPSLCLCRVATAQELSFSITFP